MTLPIDKLHIEWQGTGLSGANVTPRELQGPESDTSLNFVPSATFYFSLVLTLPRGTDMDNTVHLAPSVLFIFKFLIENKGVHVHLGNVA